MRVVMHELMRTPKMLTIANGSDGAVLLTDEDGHVTHLVPNDKKVKEQLSTGDEVERKTHWDGQTLVSEIKTGDTKLTQSYQAAASDGRLNVTTHHGERAVQESALAHAHLRAAGGGRSKSAISGKTVTTVDFTRLSHSLRGRAPIPPSNQTEGDMRRKLVLGLVMVAALGATVTAYFTLRGGPADPQITAVAITRGSILKTVQATGTLQAVSTVEVGSQVSGRISELHADFNSIVHKGEIIARLDPSLFQAQVDQARATLARIEAQENGAVVQQKDAQNKLTRAKDLAKSNLIATQDLEAAQTDV